MFSWLIGNQVVSSVIAAATFVFAISILGQRRATGSALAWVLAVVLIPWLGIPLYLAIGGRKLMKKKPLARAPVSTAEPVPHGAIEWLDDGVIAYETLLREIRRAERSIRIQTYLIGADDVGATILRELAARAGAGVAVHLLIDDLLITSTPREPLRDLVRAGGKVARFMPLLHVPFRGRSNLRNHRKIAIFDDARAIVGGMNVALEYMGPEPIAERWRDLSILIGGSAVAALDAIFRADWEFATKVALPPVGDHRALEPGIEVIPSGPDSAGDAIYDEILTAAFRANRRIWVATPYYVPDDAMSRALEIAARRGVDVRVVVPFRSNHRIADLVAAPLLRQLEKGGGRVHRYTSSMLHAKAVLADDKALVGSANFDMRSMFLNYEVALAFTRPDDVARVARWFEATFAVTTVGAPPARWLRAHVEDTFRLLAPLV